MRTKAAITGAALAAVVLAAVVAMRPPTLDAREPARSSRQAQVERGKYLVVVGGCHDCHSPKAAPGTIEPDPKRLLSGRHATTAAPAKPANMGEIAVSGDLTAWHGPWGVSYAANLTPHPVTGIGKRYTEARFIKTIRSGKKPEGEPLLPPMPWENYAKMTDADLKAIYAYLQTLDPIDNNVRTAVPVRSAK